MADAYLISGGGGSSGVAIQNTQPTAQQIAQGYTVWVNTSNSTMLYWNGSVWVQIVGVWG